MTQAELPQLSLRRYLDLVKRRRWQVVPVSLLGLLVGGLVAFFIPRFFVAETMLMHQQLPGKTTDRENPFGEIVATAKTSIPLYVEAAIEQLNWPEINGLVDFEQQQFYRSVESRVFVQDRNGGDKSRRFATLFVQYRDRDGKRSADLLNKLVEVWMEERLDALREPAKKRNREAGDKAARARQTLQGYDLEKQSLETRYGIDPQVDPTTQMREYTVRQADVKKRAQELRTKKKERILLEVRLEQAQKELALINPRVKPEAQLWLLAAAKHPEAARLLPQALLLQHAYENNLVEGTAGWYVAKGAYEMSVDRIKQLLPQVEVGPDGMVPNPDHSAKLEEVKTLTAQVEVLRREIQLLEEGLKAEALRGIELSEGLRLYVAKQRQIEEAESARTQAVTDQRDAQAQLAALTRDRPIQVMRSAQVPPVPTDPNILVVALIGCVLGLGAAIGLILLLDMLQGSFKTLDDVERGLGVPVLGGVSYLETEEQRVVAVRGRKRATIAAAVALFLVTVVVTVFYVDPTRLPSVVRDVLTMLLGA